MAKRTSQRPEYEAKQFTAESINQGIARLQKRIEDVKALQSSRIMYNDGKVDAVQSAIRNTIREIFGDRSHEYQEHAHHQIFRGAIGFAFGRSKSTQEIQAAFERVIPDTITMLEGVIAQLEEKRESLPISSASPHSSEPIRTSDSAGPNRKVFVVHGHDDGSKDTVARFLERLKLEPIILHEQPNRGRTILEKFEGHAAVGYAVILLTPDDFGGTASNPAERQPRARQNVVLEFGYFLGALGRQRVCALYKSGVELPSDLDGLVYVSFDGTGWKMELAREIDAAGIDVDLNLAK